MDLTLAHQIIRRVLSHRQWPGAEESISYGTPALKVRGKLICRIHEEGWLVLRCPMEEKEMLMQATPEIFFETDHYRGWPAVLINLDQIDEDELAEHLERSWRRLASKKMIAEYQLNVTGSP